MSPGKAHLDRGELEAALIALDTAKTNDADNRQDIQQALAQTISELAAETPTRRRRCARCVHTTSPGRGDRASA